MSRVVFVLVLAVVAFALLLNLAPDVVERLLFQAGPGGSVTAHAGESQKPARKKPASAKLQEKSPIAESAAPMTDTAVAASENEPASRGPLRSVFSVSAEEAALYSANAPGGAIISHLRKGDVVEPQFTLNSSGQDWTFVSVTDQKVSGFLRSDTLGKGQTEAGTTSR